MVDLREFSGYLMGMKIKPRHQKGGNSAEGDYIISKREYVIEAVYPHHVRCRTLVNEENGVTEVECFSVGDLIQMGLIISTGRRMYTPTAKGVREPHGHGG